MMKFSKYARKKALQLEDEKRQMDDAEAEVQSEARRLYPAAFDSHDPDYVQAQASLAVYQDDVQVPAAERVRDRRGFLGRGRRPS